MKRFAWPSGPRRPALLQAVSLAHRPFRFLEWCRDNHGDVFTINTPPLGKTPIFSHPRDVEHILALDGDVLHGGLAQAPVVDFAGERSLMKLDGDLHLEHREILSRALRPSGLPRGGADLLEMIGKAVDQWPLDSPFDLSAAIDKLALQIVAELVFNEVPQELMIEASRAMKRLRRASTLPGLLLNTVSNFGRGHFRTVRGMTERYIAESARVMEETAVTGRSLFERIATQESLRGSRLDSEDLRDELMTVLTAMLGGLICAVKHAFYWVIRTPGVQLRIQKELSNTRACNSPNDISNNLYLESVCKEVLRLCPDIPFAVRKTLIDVKIGPYRLPAATTVGIGIYLLHRRKASFPDPDRFVPDRFLTARPSRFEYMPFGGGRRGCVAGPLVVFLEKLILGSVFGRYQLRLCDNRQNPVTSFALVSTPARPLRVIAERMASPGRAANVGIAVPDESLHWLCPHAFGRPHSTDQPSPENS